MLDSSSVLNPASPQAQANLDMFSLLLLISVVIFVFVAGMIIYNIVRFRRRPGQDELPQIFGYTKLEVACTLIPALIVAIIFGFTFKIMRALDAPMIEETPNLIVIGHQGWEIEYPGSGVITANKIHVPVGEKLLIRLESADVVHSFRVPELAHKIDAIPGRSNYIWLEASQPDTYLGVCAGSCGAQHAWMRLQVIADPPETRNP